MKVHQVMTKDVVTVWRETALKRVAELLVDHRITGVPVLDGDGRVRGVLSEADILAEERHPRTKRGLLAHLVDRGRGGELHERLEATTAGEAMTSPPVTIEPYRTVAEAAATMLDREVNRLPVVENGRLVGIVTRGDLVRAFARSDATIADEIKTDVLLRTVYVPPGTVDVEVVRGEVTLSGEIDSRGTAELLTEFVRRVPGVVSVDSKVTWRRDERASRGVRARV